MYTSIQINYEENRFTIGNSREKPAGMNALQMLERIEEAMTDARLTPTNDISSQNLWFDLKSRAESIKNGYLAKTRRICRLCRFVRRISVREEAIEAVYNRIFQIPTPTTDWMRPTLQGLPSRFKC